MLSEKQHIDDFFRRKEEAFTPDEQHIDAQWQQMRTQLTDPGPKSTGNRSNATAGQRITKFLGGLIIIALITILAILPKRSGHKTVQKQSTIAVTKTDQPVKHDTISDPDTTSFTRNAIPTSHKGLSGEIASESASNSNYADLPPQIDTANGKPDAYALLQAFYKQLEKEEQEFYIEADRDTTLAAKEGTRLFVPANILIAKAGPAKGLVKIVIREYYRTEDIIAARLHTTSNGQQLVTGGMVHISAEQDGEPVLIAPQKAITINMPTNIYDNRMQLFTGQEIPSEVGNSYELNWIPAEPFFQGLMNCGNGRMLKALNVFEVEPFTVNYGRKTIAKFYLSENVYTPRSQVIKQLKARFGDYYDVIKIRRARKNKSYGQSASGKPYVIDSISTDVNAALASKKLTKQDSLRLRALLKQDSVYNYKQALMSNAYQFAISNFGFINCDRFLNDPRPKVTMTVNFGEGTNANNYVSMLLFTRYRSVCRNNVGGGHKIYYTNIPEDEPAILITVTVKDDKVVSNIQSLTTSNTVVNDLPFEPVTPAQFKQKLQSLFASQQQ